MTDNPYKPPSIPATGEQSSAAHLLPRPLAFALAGFSLIMAACFALTVMMCFFDASFSTFKPPWEWGKDAEAGMTVLFWSVIGLVAWITTAWAAITKRKGIVAAALAADAAILVSIALL